MIMTNFQKLLRTISLRVTPNLQQTGMRHTSLSPHSNLMLWIILLNRVLRDKFPGQNNKITMRISFCVYSQRNTISLPIYTKPVIMSLFCASKFDWDTLEAVIL